MSTYIEELNTALALDREAVTKALDSLSEQGKSMLVQTSEARPEDVKHVMANEHSDQHYWVRLPNGDLLLAVYPQGDTYFDAVAVSGI